MGATTAAAGVASLALVGCGDDDSTTANSAGGSPSAVLTPAATPTVPATVKSGGKVTMVVPSPDTLDPQRAFQVPIRSILYALYDGLVGFDVNLNVVPGLATKWELVDGKDYVLTLRQGVKFHDETDFNADAVVINFNRLIDPATKSPDAAVFKGVTAAAVDAMTVKFTLGAPNSDFLLNLAEKPGLIISPAALTKYGNEIGTNPVGAGPFQFVEWVKQDHVTVKKFPGYWDKGLPYLDEITFRDTTDGSVVAAGLRSGDIQIGNPSPADFAAFQSDSSFQQWTVPGIGNASDIIFFPKNAPFTDKRVRQAVLHALDRDAINKVVYANQYLPAHGIIPPSFWAYNKDIDKTGFTFDKKKATDFMSAAGVAGGFEFTNYIQNDATSVRLGETMQAMLQDVGITMKLEALEANARIARQQVGDIQATNAGFSGRVALDQYFTLNYFSTGGFNYAKYAVPERDSLILKARASFDRTERTTLYQQLEQMIVDDPGPRMPHEFLKNSYFVAKGMGQAQQAYLPDNMIRFKWVYRSLSS